jgi:hypothetical protein
MAQACWLFNLQTWEISIGQFAEYSSGGDSFVPKQRLRRSMQGPQIVQRKTEQRPLPSIRVGVRRCVHDNETEIFAGNAVKILSLDGPRVPREFVGTLNALHPWITREIETQVRENP